MSSIIRVKIAPDCCGAALSGASIGRLGFGGGLRHGGALAECV